MRYYVNCYFPLQASNDYMDKYGSDIPYIQNFRMPEMPEISLPETLFLNTYVFKKLSLSKQYCFCPTNVIINLTSVPFTVKPRLFTTSTMSA